ncbi:helix-turn-helix domain-containing protein [Roseomonas hellenica]|uniref:Helix-turn-helix domain-containing protein n=1 Tax=Plastoroseomonas hellenica TaxID=2687306 RepID=A0ABS5F004_9PROT|nr:helix-turn-helix domain-containing protein [Plastoroseomonas hellenica]MBR0665879.1 helix-turn-helix domain-containing protein [Plastoroseomonas hellenica]
MTTLSIGELARATGVKATTIRWYETEGLLPPPARTEGGHRVYGTAHRDRLGFIRHARELGFPMPAIRDLLDLAAHPDRDCNMAHAVATAQVTAIDAKLRQLTALRAELARMAEACAGGAAGHCRILETLADHAHGHCADPSHGDPARTPKNVMQPAAMPLR